MLERALETALLFKLTKNKVPEFVNVTTIVPGLGRMASVEKKAMT